MLVYCSGFVHPRRREGAARLEWFALAPLRSPHRLVRPFDCGKRIWGKHPIASTIFPAYFVGKLFKIFFKSRFVMESFL